MIIRRLCGAALMACVLCGVIAASAMADNYVALGDSYSAGTGTRDYSINSSCNRGPYAYPELIRRDRPNTTLTTSGTQTSLVITGYLFSMTFPQNPVSS